MYRQLFVGFLCWSVFWSSLLCVLSSFAIILTRKRELTTLLLLSFGRLVIVNSYGAVGLSAVCDCCILIILIYLLTVAMHF